MLSPEDLDRVRMIQQLIKVKGLTMQGIRHLWALLPCWEFRGCASEERNTCGVFVEERHEPCWMVQNRNGCCSDEACRKCEVYRTAAVCTEDLKSLVYDLMGGKPDTPISAKLCRELLNKKREKANKDSLGDDVK